MKAWRVRHVQSARKNAGLSVDDRIKLSLSSHDDELSKAIAEHEAVITAETLATGIAAEVFEHSSDVSIEGAALTVSLERTA